jgi:hypothetical protein
VHRCLLDDLSHEIQPVIAACKCERRLASVFGRQLSHCSSAHVRRVGHDEIVATRANARVEVGLNHADTRPQLIVGHVAPGDVERITRDIRGIHARVHEGFREHDGKAAGPGAEIERFANACGSGDPRPQVFSQELGYERTRDDHTFVHVETKVAEPRFLRQVSRGLSRAHALFDDRIDTQKFIGRENTCEMSFGIFGREPERVKHEPRCFVARVRRAVPETDARRFQAARCPTKRESQGPGRARALSRAHPD